MASPGETGGATKTVYLGILDMNDSLKGSLLDCPHCDSPMKIRTSKQMTPHYRVLYMYCTDFEGCGFRCKSDITYEATLAPSRIPNPEVTKSETLAPETIEQLRKMGYEVTEAKPSAN
jgi:C4-type Zn-finger protein